MRTMIILMALVVVVIAATPPQVDWQKICADKLSIDLTAPREDYESPALSILTTMVQKDFVGIAAFADSNIHFFIAKPNGKIIYQSNPTEVYAYTPDDIKIVIDTVVMEGKPGFILRFESFSGGSGMGETDSHWELFSRGMGGEFESLLGLDSMVETVYSRWYGGDNITAWTSGGTNGQRFSPEFIPQKGQYPLLLVRYEEFSAGDMHPPTQGSEDITDVWYQLYNYDRKEGEYLQITDVADPSFDLIDPTISRLAIARIMEDDGDYSMAYQTYQEMAGSANEEAAKAASVDLKRLSPSATYDFEDLKLFKAQDYKTLREKYPKSPLTARAIMMGENQSAEDLLGVIRDFPGTPDAEGAAFVILYNGIGTAMLADRAAMDKAMDYLKATITDPSQLAYYYGIYADNLFGMAVDDTMNEKAVDDALVAYDAGLKADPTGNFAGYLRLAHARALAASGDEKRAVPEMLSFLRDLPDDWWTGEGWEWLAERVAGAKDGSVTLDGGTVAEIGPGQTLVLASRYLSDQEQNYWTYGYLLKGTQLYEQFKLPGNTADAWNADVMAKGSHDLFLYTTPNNDHLVLFSARSGKIVQLLDADMGETYGRRPFFTLDAGNYPVGFGVRTERTELHFTWNPKTGVFGQK